MNDFTHKSAPAPRKEQAMRHIQLLTGSDDTPVLVQAYDDLDIRERTVNAKGELRFVRKEPRKHLIAQFFGPIAQIWSDICAINCEGAGIAVLINEHQTAGTYFDGYGNARLNNFNCTKANITRARVIFQEADDRAALNAQFPIAPSFTVQTSKGKEHRYWVIDGGTDEFEQWEGVERHLITSYDSDPAAKDVSRRLRLAGTLHQKNPQYPTLVEIGIVNGVAYSFEEIKEAFPPQAKYKKLKERTTLGRDGHLQERVEVDVAGQMGEHLVRELSSALTAIDADCGYEDWRNVLFGLHFVSKAGKDGFDLAARWSQSVERCASANAIAAKWEQFSMKEDGITQATIFDMAIKNGWTKPVLQVAQVEAASLTVSNPNIQLIETEFFKDDEADALASNEEEEGREYSSKSLYEARKEVLTKLIPPKDARPMWRCVHKNMVLVEGDKRLTILKAGLYYHYIEMPKGASKEDKEEVLRDAWLCSPLEVVATTRDTNDKSYGVYLKFKPKLSDEKHWAMPSEFAIETGVEVRAYLASNGWVCSTNQKYRNWILDYINTTNPRVERICTDTVGWVDSKYGQKRTYVLPGQTVGERAGEIVFQSRFDLKNDGRGTRGSLEVWRNEVTRFGNTNPLLALNISAGLAGILLEPAKAEGGGINNLGASSTGKSTLLRIACSIFGDWRFFANSWTTTENGLEGLATSRNDGTLFLDEIGKSEPRAVNNIAYALANGIGKQRATRTGESRAPKHWRVFTISTGEKSLESVLSSIGVEAMGGQVVRLPSVSCIRKAGVWDDLQEFGSGRELSDYFKSVVSENYGHAAIEYVKAMCDDPRDFEVEYEAYKASADFSHADVEATRVGSKFALLAFAGELAIEYGIVGWAKGTAHKAAKLFFDEWAINRPKGSTEINTWLNSLQDFILTNRDAHFTASDEKDASGNIIRLHSDRYGWFYDDDEVWLLSSALQKALGVSGGDFTRVRKTLVASSVINSPTSKPTITKRPGGRATEVYLIKLSALRTILGFDTP